MYSLKVFETIQIIVKYFQLTLLENVMRITCWSLVDVFSFLILYHTCYNNIVDILLVSYILWDESYKNVD